MTKERIVQDTCLHWFNPEDAQDVEHVRGLLDIVKDVVPQALISEIFDEFLQGIYFKG